MPLLIRSAYSMQISSNEKRRCRDRLPLSLLGRYRLMKISLSTTITPRQLMHGLSLTLIAQDITNLDVEYRRYSNCRSRENRDRGSDCSVPSALLLHSYKDFPSSTPVPHRGGQTPSTVEAIGAHKDYDSRQSRCTTSETYLYRHARP